jgi:hypothetical protein
MVGLDNWIPVNCGNDYQNYGKIMSDTSILGRFFKLSLFAEDDPKIVDKFFPMKMGPQLSNEILNMIGKQMHPLHASLKVG